MMKLKIISVIVLFLSGCATVQGGNNNLPQHQIIANSIDDKEFIYEGNAYPERTKKLSREDLKHDVAVLVAILERGYSGRDHLPKEKALREFKKFYKKEPAELHIIRKGSNAPFGPKKGYDKPIRILIDKRCGSACEGGYARFLSHPKVRTYGTNTRGAYHYGDTKPLVLPRSSVLVSIPTSFREFPDGRYIEKIGYIPDVQVPDGHDALEVALKELIEGMNRP